VATKRVTDGEKLVTRAEMIRMFNLYHSLHHIPWYRKLWRKVKAK
jgi:hypothetical protein